MDHNATPESPAPDKAAAAKKPRAPRRPRPPVPPEIALGIACQAGDGDGVEAALARGADPMSRLCLEMAIRSGSEPALAALLLAGPPHEGWPGRMGEALEEFAQKGEGAALRAALAAGAPPDGGPNRRGRYYPPLSWAAMRGDLEAIRALAAAGASLDGRAHEDRGDGFVDKHSSPLREAVRADKPRSIELLAALGADVEALDSGGFTALGSAASRGRSDCVRALLAAGASMSARTSQGYTPTMLAILVESADCLVLLAEAGGDIDSSEVEETARVAGGAAARALMAINEARGLRAETPGAAERAASPSMPRL